MVYPIAPSTVHRIIVHLSPLEDPLPQNLISKPLLRRHHFLALTLDDAADYVAWPSSQSDQSHVLRLLDGQAFPSLGDEIDVKYTADSDDLFAHVCISPHLRLVFLWEKEIGWQYHSLDNMPFPYDAVDFNHAYVLHSKYTPLPESEHEVKASDAHEDDSYWNSYGQHNDENEDETCITTSSKEPEDNSEDAYWARYSTIQGSADSTIPSPLPPAKDLKSEVVSSTTTSQECPESVIETSTELIYRVEQHTPLKLPSAASVCHRLEVLPCKPNFVANLTTTQLEINAEDCDDSLRTIMRDTIRNLFNLWRPKSVENGKDEFIDAVKHALEEL